jgi:hypothetical protein
MRRPRVVVSILRRTDVWATPLWTQPRLRWLRTLGLPCTTPRESLRPANRPTWPRAGAAATSRACRAVQLAAPRRRVPLLVCVVEHTLEPQNPPRSSRFPSAGRQDRRRREILLQAKCCCDRAPTAPLAPPLKPLPSPCAARGRRRRLAASRGRRTAPAPPPAATGAVPASSDLAPTSNTPR